jgi:Single-strand binding protein family
MDRVSITVTGRLGTDPRLETTEGGTVKVIMSLAAEPRSGQDGPTRWYKVLAFKHVASHAAESLRKGDCVTVRADDAYAWAWVEDGPQDKPVARGAIVLLAYDIAASTRFDTLTTGETARKAAQVSNDPAPTDAREQADLSVLAGVTA